MNVEATGRRCLTCNASDPARGGVNPDQPCLAEARQSFAKGQAVEVTDGIGARMRVGPWM